jgi:phospholipid/cholesterol/gamma-HCH transport system substrate-binding protein
MSATNRNPEVEEVLSALSLLLNGGGVAQLKTISTELNAALEGRESSAKSVLSQLREFMGQLDENKGDIVDAIDSLNRLAKSANAEKATIESALDDLPGALDSLDSQREDLIKMLQALGKLGNVGTRVIRASKTATIDALTQLQPVLANLAATGDDFANSFHVFLTYPFVDEVVGRDPEVARRLPMGDYTNLSIKMDVDLGSPLPGGPTVLPTDIPLPDPTDILNAAERCIRSGNLASRACRQFLEDPTRLRRECRKERYKNSDVCRAVRQLPGGGDGPIDPGDLPTIGLGGALPGLGRTGPFQEETSLAGLMDSYNPILVGLLLPGVAE